MVRLFELRILESAAVSVESLVVFWNWLGETGDDEGE